MIGRRMVGGILAAIVMGALLTSPAARAQPTVKNWGDPTSVWSLPRGWKVVSVPETIVDRKGIVTAVWVAQSGTKARIVAARSERAGWRASTLASIDVPAKWASTGELVRLALSDNDDVIAAWALDLTPISSLRHSWKVQGTAFTAGAWQPAAALVDGPDTSLLTFSAVGAPDGATVLWQSAPGASQYTTSIRALRFAAGAWSTPVVIDDDATLAHAKLLRESASDTRVVWAKGSSLVSALESASGWSTLETVATLPSEAATSALPFDAAGDVAGGTIVAWPEAGYVKATLRTGAGWSAPSVVDATGPGPGNVGSVDDVSLAGGASVVIARPVLKCCYEQTVYRLVGDAWTALPTLQARAVFMTGTRWTLLGQQNGLVADVETAPGWTTAPAPAAVRRVQKPSVTVAPDGRLLLAYVTGPDRGLSRMWFTQLNGTAWSPVRPVPVSSKGSLRPARIRDFLVTAVGTDGRITAMWSDGRAVRAVQSR